MGLLSCVYYSPWSTLGYVDSAVYGMPSDPLSRRQVLTYNSWITFNLQASILYLKNEKLYLLLGPWEVPDLCWLSGGKGGTKQAKCPTAC